MNEVFFLFSFHINFEIECVWIDYNPSAQSITICVCGRPRGQQDSADAMQWMPGLSAQQYHLRAC